MNMLMCAAFLLIKK